jgi:hypothetical protein
LVPCPPELHAHPVPLRSFARSRNLSRSDPDFGVVGGELQTVHADAPSADKTKGVGSQDDVILLFCPVKVLLVHPYF